MKYLYKTFLLVTICLIHFNFTSSAQSDKQDTPYYELILSFDTEKKLLKNKMIMVFDTSQLINRKLKLNIANAAEVNSIEAEGLINTSIHSTEGVLKQIILTFDDELAPQLSVKMDYELKIPDKRVGNMISEDWIMLSRPSFWFPSLVDFTPFKYSMQLELDNSYQVVSGDYLLRPKKAVDNYLLMSRISRTDIAFSAAKKLYSIEGKYTVVFASKSNDKLEDILSASDSALQFLMEYIEKPNDFNHKRQTLLSPLDDFAFGFKNYIVLKDVPSKSQKEMSRFLTHEYALYWFSSANPDSKHAWLSESFAEYLSLIYLRETEGNLAFEEVLDQKRNAIVSDTTVLIAYDRRPSNLALYHKGPLILSQFEQYLGTQQFKKLLNRMIDLRIDTNEELYNLISTEFDSRALDELHRLRSTI